MVERRDALRAKGLLVAEGSWSEDEEEDELLARWSAGAEVVRGPSLEDEAPGSLDRFRDGAPRIFLPGPEPSFSDEASSKISLSGKHFVRRFSYSRPSTLLHTAESVGVPSGRLNEGRTTSSQNTCSQSRSSFSFPNICDFEWNEGEGDAKEVKDWVSRQMHSLSVSISRFAWMSSEVESVGIEEDLDLEPFFFFEVDLRFRLWEPEGLEPGGEDEVGDEGRARKRKCART